MGRLVFVRGHGRVGTPGGGGSSVSILPSKAQEVRSDGMVRCMFVGGTDTEGTMQ